MKNVKNEVFKQLFTHPLEYLSGEEMAKALGVSRAAVCKAVKNLREEGYLIHSTTNRGYSLSLPQNDCSPAVLQAILGIDVLVFDSLPSTNAYALTLSRTTPVLVVANEQTMGKGRHGKSFSSPPDQGLYFTFLFFPKSNVNLRELTFFTASETAKILGAEAREQELFLKGKKIGGVLCEGVFDLDEAQKIAVGIGIYNDGSKDKEQQLLSEIFKILSEKLK